MKNILFPVFFIKLQNLYGVTSSNIQGSHLHCHHSFIHRQQLKESRQQRPAKAIKQVEEPESDGHPDSESTADADAETIEPFEDFESAVDAPSQQQQSMFPFISGPPVLGKTGAAFLDDLDIHDNNRLQIENELLLAS
jgi:hypothetical protein